MSDLNLGRVQSMHTLHSVVTEGSHLPAALPAEISGLYDVATVDLGVGILVNRGMGLMDDLPSDP